MKRFKLLKTFIVFSLVLLELFLSPNVYSRENVFRKQITEVLQIYQTQMKLGCELRDNRFKESAKDELRISLNALMAVGVRIEDIVEVMTEEIFYKNDREEFVLLLRRFINEGAGESLISLEVNSFFKRVNAVDKTLLQIQQLIAEVVVSIVPESKSEENRLVGPVETSLLEIPLWATVMPPGFEVPGNVGAVMTLIPAEQIANELNNQIVLVLNGQYDLKTN